MKDEITVRCSGLVFQNAKPSESVTVKNCLRTYNSTPEMFAQLNEAKQSQRATNIPERSTVPCAVTAAGVCAAYYYLISKFIFQIL